MKKIGLLFGSFNPLHNGHIQLAQAAQQEGGLEDVYFVLQPKNSYKPAFDFIDYEARKKLIVDSGLRLYTPQSTNYQHYILDTLKEFPDMAITLILGEDLAKSFPRWQDYQQIKDLTTIYESRRIDDISSGLVRDRLAAGEPIDDLVPRSVRDYLVR